ncbi:MAG: thiamine pyrophosphate-binding protein [Acidimicrobiia bacterium]|nr:thiamine pyrophosphate-binding protein [Acidimicrobiia bacterium]MDH3396545.1 thiamine pyrophosphate-binding protein [Acidimicrobiia bacterium]
MAKIHGGQIIARALKYEGVDTIFTLTGGHIVAILDGCVQEGIRVVDVRHEQAAIHAAEAYYRLTGKLGVAAVTAGPGVTDAITGVANAWFSGAPVLLLGGRHFIRQELKGGLQEMDHPRLFRSITAWAATAWETNRLADYIATASRHAFSGRGAPVFLDVPMDVQFDLVEESTISWPEGHRPSPPGASANDVAEVAARLSQSERPVVFAGCGLKGQAELRRFAGFLQAPVYLSGNARGALPYGHPLLGSRRRSMAFADADLVLALGVDWDFRTGYGQRIHAHAHIVQVDADPTKVGWNRPAHTALTADPARFLAELNEVAELYARTDVRRWTQDIMDEENAAQVQAEQEAESDASPVHPERFAREVADYFADSIISLDGGDIVSTTAKWLRPADQGDVLVAGAFGTLGTGAPFALAAQVVHPDRRVGIVFGDGAFGFNGMEFDTFVRLGLPVIGVIGNDGVWNNIKTFHRAFYPDRLVATDLGVRPYHLMVEGLGGYGEFVDRPDEIRPALERAAASSKPALVNVHIAETFRASSNYAQ